MRFNLDQLRKDMLMKRCIDNRLTLQEVADMLGLHKSTLCRIENSSLVPTLDTFCRICEWLGNDPSSYFIKSDTSDAVYRNTYTMMNHNQNSSKESLVKVIKEI